MGLIEMKLGFYKDLENACVELKQEYIDVQEPNTNLNTSIKETLNKIFDKNICRSVLFTNNTDKFIFGVYVDPVITDYQLMQMITTEDSFETTCKDYNVEIDLTIFKYLSGQEAAAYIIEDVSSMLDPSCIENVRYLFDQILVNNGEYIDIRKSINYVQILIYGVKNTLQKVTSLLYKYPDSIATNPYIEAFDIVEVVKDVTGILRKNAFGIEDITTIPKLSVIQWVLMVYKDLDINYKMAESTLLEAKELTGSVLEKKEIERTLVAIHRAIAEIVIEVANIEEALNETSLFKKMKKKGLQAIQDDLFEFKIRLKNCEDIEEAMYILRQINSRISILEDYLDSNECSDAERARWIGVIEDFIRLRAEISAKKLGPKKQYDIWYNIDAIDKMKD